MSSLLLNIRRKILGKTLADRCEKGETLTDKEIQYVVKRFTDRETTLLTHHDVINICSLKMSSQFNEVKYKILGNTDSYCDEKTGGRPIPLNELVFYKTDKLQNLFTDTEFIHICKSTGWYEQAVNVIYDIIVNNNVQTSKQRIKIRLKDKIMSIHNAIKNNTRNNENFKNLNIVEGSHTFYSSLPFYMEQRDFKLMKILWCSAELSQSMLYMLETDKILQQPVMFSFNFNRDMLILNATDFENETIFNDVLDEDTIDRLKRAYKFDFGNNVHILCVIEAINKLTQDSSLKIFGYRNRYDQNELALINFNDVVDRYTIRRAIFDKVILENLGLGRELELTFPFNNKSLYEMYLSERFKLGSDPRIRVFNQENFQIINSFKIVDRQHTQGESRVYRASCPDVNLKILYYYDDDDEKELLTFNCSVGVKDDEIQEDLLYLELV